MGMYNSQQGRAVDQVPARRTDSKQKSVVCALVAVFAVAQYTVCIITRPCVLC